MFPVKAGEIQIIRKHLLFRVFHDSRVDNCDFLLFQRQDFEGGALYFDSNVHLFAK